MPSSLHIVYLSFKKSTVQCDESEYVRLHLSNDFHMTWACVICLLTLRPWYTWSIVSYHKSIVKEANDGSDRKVSEYTEYTICYVWKAVRLLMLHLNMDYI